MQTGLNMSKQRKQRNAIPLRSLRYLLLKVPIQFVKIRAIRVKTPNPVPISYDNRHPNNPRLARPTARVVGPASRRQTR